jgi:hypothetical protein
MHFDRNVNFEFGDTGFTSDPSFQMDIELMPRLEDAGVDSLYETGRYGQTLNG